MVSGQPGDKAALVVSIIAICVSISVLIVSGLSYRLAKKAYNLSKAEPKFEITLEQETPPNPISSQKSDSYRIFEPSPERYSKANSGKNAGRENRITLTNIGEAPSQLTAVEIALKDPFSVSLIAFHVPGLGWLKAYYRNIEYDKLNYQHAIIKIDRKIGKGESIEIYPLLVYSKIKRDKYSEKDKIENALTVTVNSGVQKFEPPSKERFALSF